MMFFLWCEVIFNTKKEISRHGAGSQGSLRFRKVRVAKAENERTFEH
jgi:hypothetical protein